MILFLSRFKFIALIIFCVGLFIFHCNYSYAATNQGTNQTTNFANKLQHQDHSKPNKPVSLTNIGGSIQHLTHLILPKVYHAVIDIFIVFFLLGIIGMALAMTTKNGQFMKWASRSMYGSLIGFLLIQILPIFILTTSISDFNMFVSDVVSLTKSINFYITLGMVVIGFFMKIVYNFVSHHPEYYKWSRALFLGAVVLGLVAGVAPLVFRSI